jgi:hypothetical protein
VKCDFHVSKLEFVKDEESKITLFRIRIQMGSGSGSRQAKTVKKKEKNEDFTPKVGCTLLLWPECPF